VFSTIILVYSFLAGSRTNIAIGISSLFLSFLALFVYRKRFITFYLQICVLICISFIILIRVLLLFQFTPINENEKRFSASVESVKALRYSNEVVLNFFDPNNIQSGFPSTADKAVSYIDKEIKINTGDEIEIYAKPKEIKFDNNKISSFETDLLRKGFHFIFYLNIKNYRVLKSAPVILKEKIRNIIENNLWKLFNAKTVPIIKGLYFANSSYIDKSTTIDFKRAGVLHILAASGEHIGIVAGILLLAFSPFLINRKVLRVIIALVLLFYLYITDMPVSLLRAFVMYYVFSIQQIFDLEKNIFNTLFLSAIIILVIYPYELYSLGFQLSFGATFGILLFYNFYKNIFLFLPSKISSALAVTFSAQIFVLPIIFIQLNEINLAGFFSNIILVFTMSGTMILSVITNIISVVTIMPAKYFALLTDYLYLISLKVVQYFSGINGHFAVDGGKGLLLLLPFLFFLLPVMPVKINRKILCISIIISISFTWLILSVSYSVNKNKIAIFGTNDKVIVLQKENIYPIIFGNLSSYKVTDNIAYYVNRNNIRNINVCIPNSDFNNLKNYTSLIKKVIVLKCYITPDFMFTGYFKKFCQILDADGIGLKINDFKKYNLNGFTVNNTSGYLKNILLSPFENIAEIHNLLSENYLLKNAVAEEIINCGFEIEYSE
jgi:ComEC/Rec2-related protein